MQPALQKGVILRFITVPLLLIVLLIGGVGLLTFTSSGNKIVLPYINIYLKQKVDTAKIVISAFRLKPDSLEATARVNDTIDVTVEGPFNILGKSFSLNYTLYGKKIQSNTFTLHENIHINGTAKGTFENVKFNGEGSAFSSNIRYGFSLIDKEAKNFTLSINNAHIEEILDATAQKPYANGFMTLHIDMPKVHSKHPYGVFDLQSKGVLNTTLIKKVANINLGDKFSFNGSSKGEIKNQKLFTNIKLKTTMANLDMHSAVYDINSKRFHSKYRLNIPDLRKIKPLTGREYRGDILIRGDISKSKDLVVTGEGKEFGGSINFKLVNNHIKANIKDATVSKILYMLNYPQILEGKAEATIDYNTASRKGSMDATINQVYILPNRLTTLLMNLTKTDITKERYDNAKFLVNFSPDVIHFTLDAKNSNSHFKIYKGVLYKKSGAINITADIKVKEKDFKVTITGTMHHPNIKLDTSKYLKSKVQKKLESIIDKKLKLNNDKESEAIKDLIKKLF